MLNDKEYAEAQQQFEERWDAHIQFYPEDNNQFSKRKIWMTYLCGWEDAKKRNCIL